MAKDRLSPWLARVVAQQGVTGHHLTATAQLCRHLWHGIEASLWPVHGGASGQEPQLNGLLAAVEHQGAWHTGVVDEVARIEPVVVPQVLLENDLAQTVWAAGGP